MATFALNAVSYYRSHHINMAALRLSLILLFSYFEVYLRRSYIFTLLFALCICTATCCTVSVIALGRPI